MLRRPTGVGWSAWLGSMKYHGPLYGKIGNRTFDTGKTSDDWDKMESALKSAKDCIESNRRHIESMGRNAVAGTSATLDEIANALMPNAPHQLPPQGARGPRSGTDGAIGG